ncbi:vitamin K epoxide reductase family protein [Agromyces archimandritae]|uniref:Vitamin K epoxide reductase family protein n=1 Tax=Agromyces archimandritae TaxID=2781962 RepID=A0A975INJ8_9MICO|nr:vitamin K epoxide reductase family protein [Agromyces archimandritae]QTX04687.1 vitamin K epoxide reductase family protein [Agromyces archimandritae]
MPEQSPTRRPVAFAVFLVIAGAIGLLAAFELSLEKVLTLEDPTHVPSCNVGVLVGCSVNLASEQGSVFGFPNPFLGLMAWPAVIVVGMSLLAGARFARWYWLVFNAGLLFAFGLVCWLIQQSIYVLDVLCPWCMVTWAVTIPAFFAVTLYNLREGRFGGSERVRRIGGTLLKWVPLITVVAYAVVVILAQARMNAIPRVLIDLQNLFG